MRKIINGNSSASDVQTQENALAGLTKSINIVAENYPELKASENYGKAMDSVNLYENQVRLSRMTYNDCVTIFNRACREFPASLVAGMLGFSVRDYLDEVAGNGKSEMPSMKI